MTTMTSARVPEDTLALRLVLIRHEMGFRRGGTKAIPQREAAMETGVPFGTWQGMENGKETRKLNEHIDKICAAWGYDRAWLMWGTTPTNPGPGDAAVPSKGRYLRGLSQAA